jgi:protein-tyrosine phosphatase
MSLRILFVCYGNICRSPMAVGIAKHIYGSRFVSESAGIGASAAGAKPTLEAQVAMRSLYNADISGHRARPISSLDVGDFDYVIAMDFFIYSTLRDGNRIPENRLLGWDIEDPLGQGVDVYKATALKIQARLERFVDSLPEEGKSRAT